MLLLKALLSVDVGNARCAAAAVLVAVLLKSIERCLTRKAEAGRE